MIALKAFVVMPQGNGFADDVYKLSVEPLCEKFNLEVKGADKELISTVKY